MSELSATLGLEDLWDLIEVATIDARNARAIEQWRRRQQKTGG